MVKPLGPEDAAKLLCHLFSREGRGFNCEELGVPRGTRLVDGQKALASHNVIVESEGHPGTLVREKRIDLSRRDWQLVSSGESFCFWRVVVVESDLKFMRARAFLAGHLDEKPPASLDGDSTP